MREHVIVRPLRIKSESRRINPKVNSFYPKVFFFFPNKVCYVVEKEYKFVFEQECWVKQKSWTWQNNHLERASLKKMSHISTAPDQIAWKMRLKIRSFAFGNFRAHKQIIVHKTPTKHLKV